MVTRSLSPNGRCGRRPRGGPALAAVCLGAALAWTSPAAAKPEIEDCMDCHEDAFDEHFELADGTQVPIGIDRDKWDKSVHAKEVGCTDCHTTISDHPHPEVTAPTLRDFQIQASDTCKRCHYAHYTRVVDGIHYKLLAEGKKEAPTCVDCHGAHDTLPPGKPRVAIDKRCATCHEDVAKQYESSVHGRALIEDNNPDVPVCTDCHGAHKIRDPRDKEFRASTHEICARCHSDAEKMAKHDLNPHVVDTYLDDFHGRSNAMIAMGGGEPGKPMATCTDCHGIHDIPSFKEADKAEVRARVLKTCAKCHEDIPEGFSDAWLSHYPPTLSSAPLVWGVRWFYRIIIPFIMLGLGLHIFLHLWRFRFRKPRH